MKRLLTILLVLVSYFATAQHNEQLTVWQLKNSTYLPTFTGPQKMVRVIGIDAPDSIFFQCWTCTVDGTSVFAGASGRKWRLYVTSATYVTVDNVDSLFAVPGLDDLATQNRLFDIDEYNFALVNAGNFTVTAVRDSITAKLALGRNLIQHTVTDGGTSTLTTHGVSNYIQNTDSIFLSVNAGAVTSSITVKKDSIWNRGGNYFFDDLQTGTATRVVTYEGSEKLGVRTLSSLLNEVGALTATPTWQNTLDAPTGKNLIGSNEIRVVGTDEDYFMLLAYSDTTDLTLDNSFFYQDAYGFQIRAASLGEAGEVKIAYDLAYLGAANGSNSNSLEVTPTRVTITKDFGTARNIAVGATLNSVTTYADVNGIIDLGTISDPTWQQTLAAGNIATSSPIVNAASSGGYYQLKYNSTLLGSLSRLGGSTTEGGGVIVLKDANSEYVANLWPNTLDKSVTLNYPALGHLGGNTATFAVSVNGELADDDGNITLDLGAGTSTPTWQQTLVQAGGSTLTQDNYIDISQTSFQMKNGNYIQFEANNDDPDSLSARIEFDPDNPIDILTIETYGNDPSYQSGIYFGKAGGITIATAGLAIFTPPTVTSSTYGLVKGVDGIVRQMTLANIVAGGASTSTIGYYSQLEAYNGLTAVNRDSVKLGGSLVETTTIAAGSNYLNITGTHGQYSALAQNTSTGAAIKGAASSGAGLQGESGTGDGILGVAFGSSGSGIHGFAYEGFPLYGELYSSNTNGNMPMITMFRKTSGSAADGISGSIDFNVQHTTATTIANRIVSKWTNATGASRTSQFEVWGVNSTNLGRKMAIGGTGSITLDAYGDGTFTGTPTFALLVDADGNVIEGTFADLVSAGGGVTTSTVTDYIEPLTAGTNVSFSSGTTYDGSVAKTINVATPSLQAVTDVGFVTTNAVISKSQVGIRNPSNTTTAYLSNYIWYGTDYAGSLVLKGGANSYTSLVQPQYGLTADRNNYFPNGNGTLALSVNGVFADATGNIVIDASDIGGVTTSTVGDYETDPTIDGINGLYRDGDYIKQGGNLTENTVVGQIEVEDNSYTLYANGLTLQSYDAMSLASDGDLSIAATTASVTIGADIPLLMIDETNKNLWIGDYNNLNNNTFLQIDDENEQVIIKGIAEAAGTKTLRYDPSTGNVTYHDIPEGSTFAGLTDVNLTSLATNDFLKWDGTDWINRTPSDVRTDLGLVIGTNVQAYDADLATWATITPGSNVGTFLATPSSANLISAVTDETGSGKLVFGTSPTFETSTVFNYATASTIAIFDGSKNLISASTGTYPSLTELSYVKGVTSAIQTQLNTKGDALTTNPLSQFASTTSAQLASTLSDEVGTLGGFVRAATSKLTGSDYTNSTATGTEVTGLQISSTGTGLIYFEFVLLVQSANTGTGWKFGVNHTGTASVLALNMVYPSTGTSAATGVGEDAVANLTGSIYESMAATSFSTTSPNLGPTTGTAATGANILVKVFGLISVTATGDLELWGASEATNQITVKQNSIAIAHVL